MVREARSRRGVDEMRKRRIESEREKSEKGACFIEGCFISTATRLRLSRTRALCSLILSLSFSLSLSLSLCLPRSPSLPSSLTISHPVFPSKPRRMQTTDANPPANLHLITTITTGDSRETTSGPSPPPLSPHTFRRSFPKRTHGIAFHTIGSRSSLWQ